MKEINYLDKEYPKMLNKINNPPKILYVEGDINLLDSNSIAVIGSRNCTQYGERWCEKFTKELLEYEITIVSGMALGIDSIAHNTALKYGGKTIAVLPSGFDNIYPKDNEVLYKKILGNGGTVISEYAPKEKAKSKRFLERNRIVSGLAIGTLVVEAEYRSGTSVTAKLTKEQGKEVFCIPGGLDNNKSLGTNNMIKKGAKIVTDVEDIVSMYKFLERKKSICLKKEEKINKEYENIYNVLSKDIPLDFNEISRASKESINTVMAKLMLLEIDGKVKCLYGNKYIRSDS